MEYLEGCFYSLEVDVVTGKGVLEEMVKYNASLNITIATFTDINACLAKKVETLTEALAKKGGGGVEVPGRGPGKHYPNCKREIWHKPDVCFELERNKYKRPRYWKSCLKLRRGTDMGSP